MKKWIAILLVISWFLLPARTSADNKEQQNSSAACVAIRRVLSDYEHLKLGARRKEVERYFNRDGGGQFPSSTHYVHPSCNYLHVDVEFEVTKPGEVTFAPEDKIVNISKLYAEYPAKD
jgi:hypothetical protein